MEELEDISSLEEEFLSSPCNQCMYQFFIIITLFFFFFNDSTDHGTRIYWSCIQFLSLPLSCHESLYL